MYSSDDPRAKLAGGSAGVGAPYAESGRVLRFAAAEYVRFHEGPPQQATGDALTWFARGQNFVVAYTEAKAGAVLSRSEQLDEYMLLVPERNVEVTTDAGQEIRLVPGHALVIVPPGPSAVTVHTSGTVVRVFSTRSADLVACASNASAYAQPHSYIPPYEPWPAPPDGYRIRVYDLDIPPVKGRFGRIFRCSSLMMNVLPLELGPRDLAHLSPHHHEDFEQGSLALQGSFTHHIRWPWTANLADWRADDHAVCPAPSLCVIPPPAIHTSAGSDPRINQLVDIFAPPRMDFSKMEGWVLNANEYPLPAERPVR
jgi:hypothetical protein